MTLDHRKSDNREDSVNRRRALAQLAWTGASALCIASGGVPSSLTSFARAETMVGAGQVKLTIPIILKDTTSFYWRTVLAGARKAGEDLGAKVVELGVQSETDIDGQISMLESAVGLNPAAVVIAPAEFVAVGKAIDRVAQKVKVVGIDSEAGSNATTSFLKTDHVQAGRLAADSLATAIKRTYADTEGDVAFITPLHRLPSLDERVKGFKEQIAAKYGALALVAEKLVDDQKVTAFKAMTDLINTQPELRGVLASTPLIAQEAGRALAENNLTNKTGDKINLVGFEWDDKLLGFLKDGTVAALVVQDPFRMGYEGIKTAIAASRGEPLPANIDTGSEVITKANMNSRRSRELLNPAL
jgi:ribose transport system substrate-binding protein